MLARRNPLGQRTNGKLRPDIKATRAECLRPSGRVYSLNTESSPAPTGVPELATGQRRHNRRRRDGNEREYTPGNGRKDENVMTRLSPSARRSFAMARAEDTGACICQTVRLVETKMSFRYVKSRTRTVMAHCKHWYVVDSWTGKLTNVRVSPRIGGQTRYGASRASHKAMASPVNRQGPVSHFELS